jgi:hypothetical protein
MAQVWTLIGIMAVAFTAMIGFSYRAMVEQGKAITAQVTGFRGEVNAQIDGLRGGVNAQIDSLRGGVNTQIDGLRGEVNTQFDGFRREVNARFDHLSMRMDKIESIDRRVHALSIKVMGRDQPPED